MKRLVINADDFGMCHAVNRGIVEAFRAGLVTQTSLMVPCPWFDEAVHLALEHRIPLGVHLTATCEWPNYRWQPLTAGRSLRGADGTMHATIAEAQRCDRDELAAEFAAQVERALAAGLRLQHLDVHMGMIDAEVFLATCRRFDLVSIAPPSLLPADASPRYPFTSDPGQRGSTLSYPSIMPIARKQELFREYLSTLGDGLHFTACHPAVDADELVAMAPTDHPVSPWARDIRVSDLTTVTDRETLRLVERLGIEMVACGALPPSAVRRDPTPVVIPRR